MKTTESGGPSGCDAGKRAKGWKRHVTVDVEEFPIVIAVHEASVPDRDGAPDVILGMLEIAAAGNETVGGRRLRGAEADGGAD